MIRRLRLASLALALPALYAAAVPPPMTVVLRDYATLPVTGALDGRGATDALLARVNSLREEPGGANRLFVADLNGPLYILDKKTSTFTTYLDFNGREGHAGLFHRFAYATNWANGLIGLQFDPDYRRNGRFYTIHIEDPAVAQPAEPDSARLPGLTARGYTTTAAIATPGEIQREGVIIEWTDVNTSNAAFEGTARELLRLRLNTRIHPLGEMVFNPTARRGDADWRVLYIGSGDGGSGESRLAMRTNPQRLDTLVGKILRIVPDLGEHVTSSAPSENGRYRIPNDNPFASTPGARSEIWAYGLRNPHRLHWAVDSANAANTRLLADTIGLHTWETIDIIHKGANYGYSAREGNQALQPDNQIAPLPEIDRLPVLIGETATGQTIVPTYPVLEYGHVPGGGDAIGSGVLYAGKAIPMLRGKYVFTDISTGRLWYADYQEMLKVDDGDPATMAARHEIRIRWQERTFDSMFPIAQEAFHRRGGQTRILPGRSLISGEGRADANLAVDAAGELYVFTKSDGMIRALVSGR
jgi:hypothetical protein